MSRRLSKEESRARFAEGRGVWNGFDPIGVVGSDDVLDEYDGYVGPCLRIVEANEPMDKLIEYVRWVVYERMGLSHRPALDEEIRAFAEAFTQWYRAKWLDTVV